jgi:hypothetical protein
VNNNKGYETNIAFVGYEDLNGNIQDRGQNSAQKAIDTLNGKVLEGSQIAKNLLVCYKKEKSDNKNEEDVEKILIK